MSPSPAKSKVEIDDLLAAVETVESLKSAMADQVKTTNAIVNSIAELDARLTQLEARSKPKV